MQTETYRWLCPDPKSPSFVAWALDALLARPGRILCHPADLPALAATMLAGRVAVPETGVVQRGTIWLEEVAA